MFAKLVLGISVTHASSTLLLLVLCVADGVCHLRVYGYKHADMLVDCRHTSCSQCTFAVLFLRCKRDAKPTLVHLRLCGALLGVLAVWAFAS